MPEEQAKIRADTFRDFSVAQEEPIQHGLATRHDLGETELRLQNQIEQARYSLLKWQIGIGIAVLTIMARGFGGPGF